MRITKPKIMRRKPIIKNATTCAQCPTLSRNQHNAAPINGVSHKAVFTPCPAFNPPLIPVGEVSPPRDLYESSNFVGFNRPAPPGARSFCNVWYSCPEPQTPPGYKPK